MVISDRAKMTIAVVGVIGVIALIIMRGSSSTPLADAPDAEIDTGDSSLNLDPLPDISVDFPAFIAPSIGCGCGDQFSGMMGGIVDFGKRFGAA